eukprot:TRINITY_DN16797_c0_g1_i1.p1 TRINITY_DN16797_c0_g1~~TRINITY_DN16797_c0_g1_i1.p1  ORF type:complete len:534 (-),score=107.38 TRINITY_DN16797_c0_g1_i1:273-1874(-)
MCQEEGPPSLKGRSPLSPAMSPRPGSAARPDPLREGLATMICPGDDLPGHFWKCEPTILGLFGLKRSDLEKTVKTWWGNKDLWLSMFLTHILKRVGARLDLDQFLGSMWAALADDWLAAAYERAAEKMKSPPSKTLLPSKAGPFVSQILRSCYELHTAGLNVEAVSRLALSTCLLCGDCYVERLARCQRCYPQTATKPGTKKPSVQEMSPSDWQKLPQLDIRNELPWKSATSTFWCQGGSGGVHLVQISGGAVCIKKFVPTELLADRLAAALGIPIAHMRLVQPGCDEKKAMSSVLQALASEEDAPQVAKTVGSPFLSVIEFVDGCVMMGMPAHLLLRGEKPLENLQAAWGDLGRLCGFDLLINNYDRLPLAWNNEGNLGNVMLGASSGAVVGIDQAVHPIVHAAGLQTYRQRVQRVASDLRDGNKACCRGVQEAIFNNTAAELSPEEIAAFCGGCLEFLQGIAAVPNFKAVLDEVVEEVLQTIRASSYFQSGATSREACEAGFVLEELPKSMQHASDMILEVVAGISEALRS